MGANKRGCFLIKFQSFNLYNVNIPYSKVQVMQLPYRSSQRVLRAGPFLGPLNIG